VAFADGIMAERHGLKTVPYIATLQLKKKPAFLRALLSSSGVNEGLCRL